MLGPLCVCHSVEKYWHSDPRKPQGGYWRCRIRRQESDRRSWARAIRVGRTYFGKADTAENAAQINTRGRALLSDFKDRQKRGTPCS